VTLDCPHHSQQQVSPAIHLYLVEGEEYPTRHSNSRETGLDVDRMVRSGIHSPHRLIWRCFEAIGDL